MTYRNKLRLAVERTDKWELDCSSSRLMRRWAHHPEEYGFVLNHQPDYFARFSRALPHPPEARAISCAPVHFTAVKEMMKAMKWAPAITIGDVLLDGKPCFQVTRNSLRRDLRKGPKAEGRIHIHVWLTFADLTIYDLTIIPWRLRQLGEPMNLDRPDALAVLGNPDELKPNFEYMPMLIGPEFLWKTGTLEAFSKPGYMKIAETWEKKLLMQL